MGVVIYETPEKKILKAWPVGQGDKLAPSVADVGASLIHRKD